MKKIALASALALSFAVAAPSASAFSFKGFGGVFKGLMEKAKGPAKAAISNVREMAGGIIKSAWQSAKTQTVGFRNDLVKHATAAIQKEIGFLKNKALPQLGKGLMKTMEGALKKGWQAGKTAAWQAWKSKPKAGGIKGWSQHLKFGVSAGMKAAFGAAKGAALKGGKANFSKFFNQIEKHSRGTLLNLRKQVAASAKKRAGNVVKATKGAVQKAVKGKK